MPAHWWKSWKKSHILALTMRQHSQHSQRNLGVSFPQISCIFPNLFFVTLYNSHFPTSALCWAETYLLMSPVPGLWRLREVGAMVRLMCSSWTSFPKDTRFFQMYFSCHLLVQVEESCHWRAHHPHLQPSLASAQPFPAGQYSPYSPTCSCFFSHILSGTACSDPAQQLLVS